MFIDSEDTRATSMTSFWRHYYLLWTYSRRNIFTQRNRVQKNVINIDILRQWKGIYISYLMPRKVNTCSKLYKKIRMTTFEFILMCLMLTLNTSRLKLAFTSVFKILEYWLRIVKRIEKKKFKNLQVENWKKK